MKKVFLATSLALSLAMASNVTQARDFNHQTLDYRNIKEGPESPVETKDSKYPVSMTIVGMDLVIVNKSNKPVEVNGFFFDSAGCEVDLPKDMFRLPVGGRFITSVAHCEVGSMRYGYLNVGKQTKKFNLINW